ncbi:DNA-processing protein DprA [Aliiglaciecola sp. M165]|uniref:DNA-processing protein DprA n=1 Tax=Aliiglaciecola sp. M165 TaxID=2593649 RepID=UPI00117DED57|nr:DNA-processing protein DprA [Aliiglaciecola sp. M165]TRY28928.1 DNA-protecting protein DprA [Aliiglaciecola sp. M165]
MAQDVLTDCNDSDKANESDGSKLIDWLRIQLIPQLGPATLTTLLESTSIPATDLLSLPPRELRSLGFKDHQINAIERPNWQLIDTQLAWLTKGENRFALHLKNENYPYLLQQISSPPFVIFGIGDRSILNSLQLAIVGSRNPTQTGKRICSELAHDVAAQGMSVTSGLALGIDACAHNAALSANGRTIAVLGSGLNNIYPKRNVSLADHIVDQGGLLISEFFVNTPPKAEHFPRRNRIVSGLSHGVLVVEAAVRSGSLITAKYALEQNREVFAVPGSALNPLSAGCHHLIKQGAKLVETYNDILEEFQNVSSFDSGACVRNLQKSPCESLATAQLLDSVDYDVTALDVIIQRSNLPIKEVLAQLLQYELRGLVATVSGGYVKLRGK